MLKDICFNIIRSLVFFLKKFKLDIFVSDRIIYCIGKVQITLKAHNSNNILVKINDINSINEVKEFVNKEISVPREDFPETNDSSIYWNDLIGCSVKDLNEKDLGKVMKIENHGASDILFIKEYTEEIIIPIEDNFFKKFDNENKLIIVDWEQE